MTNEQLDELEAHAEGHLLTGDEAREELVRVIGLLREARGYVAEARAEAISVRSTLGYQLGEARAEVERLRAALGVKP